ncbi:MAG: hypothetical protein Q7V31_00240 [Parvibaculum sp.]|uniref:hypothetical protein n=1 Tax=Parvibaculum sp. TaxID=2024848 RepID=UPI00272894E0|nr:hypothetical protein [Parvibaculum sp.]MDO8837325.1 hypothetical protein [Parvibaculum sp.]
MNAECFFHHNSTANIPSLPFADLHKGTYIAGGLAWLAFIAVFWVGFATDLHSAFMIAISTVYMLMYFVTPGLMIRMAGRFTAHRQADGHFDAFLAGEVGTHTGSIGGREALIQIILVPAALTLCTGGIAYAYHAARQAAGV